MTKVLGVGIIGTGNIASGGHMPAILSNSNVQLVSILSRDMNRGISFAKSHSVKDIAVHTNILEFVKTPDLDIVIVCSPDSLHYSHATICIESGKSVLLEKPMTTTMEDCNSLLSVAQKHDVKLAIGFHLRHHVGHRILFDKIRANAIGTIRHIRIIWAWPQKDDSNWRAKDDLTSWWSLSAVGTHCLDLARWFVGDFDEWQSLKALTSNSIWGGPHDESALLIGMLKSGTTVEVTSSIQYGPYNRIEIFGETGQAICHDTLGRTGKGEILINGEKLEFTPVNPFSAQLANVIGSITKNDELVADGFAGLRNVQDLLIAMKHANQE